MHNVLFLLVMYDDSSPVHYVPIKDNESPNMIKKKLA